MRMFFLMTFLFHLSLFAIQFELKPDNNITIKSNDVEALKSFLLKNLGFHIKEDGAYNITRDNRLLANAYLKKHTLSDYDQSYIKVIIERYLADLYVDLMQKREKIDEKILLSYYYDNKDKFKEDDKVDIVLFIFPNAEDAIQFYVKGKNKTLQELKKIAKQFNALVKDVGIKSIVEIRYPTRTFLEKIKKSHYLLPPTIYSPNSADVLYVKEYKRISGYKPFSVVRDNILRILRKKTFVKERNILLRQYGLKEGKDDK